MTESNGRMELIRDENGVKVLKVYGAFTAATIPELQKVCTAVGESKDFKAILLDLKEVDAIDTSAFACMINFVKEHTSSGSKIAIVNPKQKEKGLLELLKIDNAIHTFDSEQEAMETLKNNE